MHEADKRLAGLADHAARAGEALSALARGEAVEAASAIEEAFARAGAAIESSLVSAARRGELAFDTMARNILLALADLAIERLVEGPLASAVGRILVTGPLPGPRADGGPVLPGRAYLVGERGPELFTPATAGAIEPGALGAVTVNFHFDSAADAGAFQRAQGQIATMVARAVARGRRRL